MPTKPRFSRLPVEVVHSILTSVDTQTAQIRYQRRAASQADSYIEAQFDLSELCNALDPHFAPLLSKVCNKSGRIIEQHSTKDLAGLISIHGRERALDILQRDAMHHVSPLWLYTDPQALKNLMAHDLPGFFVYVTSDFIIPQQTAPKSPTHAAPSDMDGILSGWDNSDPVPDQAALPLPDFNRDFIYLCDKAAAYRNASKLMQEPQGTGILAACAEMLRRLRGLAHPAKIGCALQFPFNSIAECCADLAAIRATEQAAEKVLRHLLNEHARKIAPRDKRRNRNAARIPSIGEMRARLQGNSALAAANPKLQGLSEVESILMDLDNFWTDELDMTQQQLRGAGQNIPPEFVPVHLQNKHATQVAKPRTIQPTVTAATFVLKVRGT